MLADLQFTTALHRAPNVYVDRGRRASGAPVVIKSSPFSAELKVQRLRYEFRLLQQLAAAGCPQLPTGVELVAGEDRLYLIMDDMGGHDLLRAPDAAPLSLAQVAHIGHQVALALERVHAARLVHKDVNPANIVFNAATQQVNLIDLGIATELTLEQQSSGGLSGMEGTVPYISPEQTGRTRRGLDYRSDFYSLGATLYQLLTGRPPLADLRPGQELYAILALDVPAPRSVRPDIPEVLSDLVLRLMRKNSDERYQSAHGVAADLRRCQEALQTNGDCPPFALQTQDRSERFELPNKVYGRDAEIAALQAALAETLSTKQTGLVFVAGVSGIGKSSLMAEVQPAMAQTQATYAAGKHDPLRRHVPFHGVSRAVSMLVRALLKEPEAERQGYERRVRGALGNIGHVLVELIPDIALLVGPQQPIAPLGPRENENRLMHLLQRFMLALCKKRPLVLFLDDLQWSDAATLKLLSTLRELRTEAGLFIVGSYRSEEVTSAHPVADMLAASAQAGRPIPVLILRPLTPIDVQRLLADALRLDTPEAVRELADLLGQRTEGNPFLLREVLQRFWEAGLIAYADGGFTWNAEAIATAAVPDSLVALMSAKIGSLTAPQSAALSAAACLGDRFELPLLAEVTEQSLQQLTEHLHAAAKLGLILPLSGAYRYAEGQANVTEFRFAHDKIREAAQALLGPEAALPLHHRAGSILAARLHGGAGEVFGVLEHLNRALSRITGADRLRVGQLNLQAALEAKRATAYAIASTYARQATELLPEPAPRELTLLNAELAYFRGDLDTSLQLLDRLLAEGGDSLAQAEVHTFKVRILDDDGRIGEAMAAGTAGMAALGYRMRFESPAALGWVLMRVMARVLTTPLERLAHAPPCQNRRAEAAMSLLGSMAPAGVRAGDTISANISLNLCLLTMQHGMCRYSASAYATLCMLLAIVDQYKLARAYGGLVAQLMEQAPVAYTGRILFVMGCWVDHLESGPEGMASIFVRAHAAALEEGDLTFASWSACVIPGSRLHQTPQAAQAAYARYEAELRVDGDVSRWLNFVVPERVARALLGQTPNPASIDVNDDLEAQLDAHALSGVSKATDSHAYSHLLMLQILFDDLDKAVATTSKFYACQGFTASANDPLISCSFYGALALIEAARRRGQRRVHEAAMLRTFVTKLRKLAQAYPQRHRGFLLVVQAALADLRGQHASALRLHDEACQHTSRSGWIDRQAVALEYAGRFFARRNLPLRAEMYQHKALAVYQAWGATRKVAQLQQRMRDEAVEPARASAEPRTSTRTGTVERSTEAMDVPALLHMSQSATEALPRPTLAAQVLAAVQQATGASRAVFLWRAGEGWTVQADTRSPPQGLPESVLQFTARVRETLVVDDCRNGAFKDAYFATAATRALICAPMHSRGQLVGLLYLENDATPYAFAADRRVMVEILAAHAAAAFENVTLHEDLERELARRTQGVQVAHARSLKQEREAAEMQMAGGFAHEMRNALSAALMPLEALAEPETPTPVEALAQLAQGLPLEPPARSAVDAILTRLRDGETLQHEVLQSAERGLNRGLRITQLTLEYAEAERVVSGDDACQAAVVVQRAIAAQQARWQAQAIEVKTEVPADALLPLREEHLQVIVNSLISNALDALATSDRPRQVVVRCSQQAGSWHLQVEDTGAGMAPSVQQAVFRPFFSTKGARGTGLALGLSRKLARIYGGDLAFTSQENAGSVFELVLPARR